MRILVLGAYGVIGSAVSARLSEAGHAVVAAGRSAARATRLNATNGFVTVDLARLDEKTEWPVILRDIDVVVHAAGVLQDGLSDDVARVQRDGTRLFYEACERYGVRRAIHISALGAEVTAHTDFMRTKAEADTALMASGLDWVILKPGLVIARQAYGGTALFKALAALPLVTPVPGSPASIQTVDVDDVAETVLKLVDDEALTHRVYELAHAERHSLADLAQAYRRWFGFRSARIIPFGRFWLQAGYGLGSVAAWLGWRNPLRTNAGKALDVGIVGDPGAWTRDTGIVPRSLAQSLARHPASVQDVWHARLYLLKPLIFAVLSVFWIVSGLIALGPGRAQAEAIFAGMGFGEASSLVVIATASLDVLVGIMIALRRTARSGLVLSALVTLAYLAGGTLMMPDLWIDALGPLVKAVPALMLTAVAAALLPSR